MTGLALILSASLFFACQQDVPTMEKPSQDQESRTEYRDLNELLSVPQRSTKVSLKQALAATQEQGQGELRALQNKRVQSTSTLYTSSGEPALYIINYSPEGYAVVSASRNYTPIVAHSPKGFISLKDDNNPAKALLEDYVRQIEYANTLPDSLTRLARMQWEMLNNEKPEHLRSIEYDENAYNELYKTISIYEKQGYKVYRYADLLGIYSEPQGDHSSGYNGYPDNSDTGTIIPPKDKWEIDWNIKLYASKVYSIDNHVLIAIKEHRQESYYPPLLTTTWGQGWYPKKEEDREWYSQLTTYNMYIPNLYVVGCVPVAIGQLMRYHKHPKYFAWEDMPYDHPTKTTAYFLYDIATKMHTTFGEESETYTSGAHSFLLQNKYKTRLFKGEVKLIELINSIADGQPIYIAGEGYNPIKKKKVGHAFIADGYESHYSHYEVKVIAFDSPMSRPELDGMSPIFTSWVHKSDNSMFHINLGWGGISNGYYHLNAIHHYNNKREYLFVTPHN